MPPPRLFEPANKGGIGGFEKEDLVAVALPLKLPERSWRLSKKRPPRMSETKAALLAFPSEWAQSSANFGMRAGGKLSTQKYPRSSKHRMASLLPAPDNPVMMTSCMAFIAFLNLYFHFVAARPSPLASRVQGRALTISSALSPASWASEAALARSPTRSGE